jgi:hypothetical protein
MGEILHCDPLIDLALIGLAALTPRCRHVRARLEGHSRPVGIRPDYILADEDRALLEQTFRRNGCGHYSGGIINAPA